MDRSLSSELFARAGAAIPGGVNSPVRSFRAVGGAPIIVERGEGAHLRDVDGNRYADFLMSWGANVLGHAHPAILAAVTEAAGRGTGYGLSTKAELEIAEIVKEAFPSIELVRFVNSGTEAVMSALRVARGFTGREKVLTFEGCYHGHSDSLLVEAGSGLATFGIPASAGVPREFAAHTLQARYNDLDSVEDCVRRAGDRVACILVEPVAGNMGVVPPRPGFLEGLREICDRIGALLAFDEVITGFRIAPGGAQERFGVRADLTVLGKIIGGGLPVGAFGGRRDVMEQLAPLGEVYQAGTLSGNPIVAAAGAAVLKVLRAEKPHMKLERRAALLTDPLSEKSGAYPVTVNRVGSMFTIFFTADPVADYASAKRADAEAYAGFFRAALERGVLLAPSQWEAGFVSLAHDEDLICDSASRLVEALASLPG
ncbi:MAG: glutamate-1-semialdehyde 2,1-aminomutase [Planctomycetota bacterium]